MRIIICLEQSQTILFTLLRIYRLELNVYEKLCDEALENLSESFDSLLELHYPEEFDVSLAVGYLFHPAFLFVYSIYTSTLPEWSAYNQIEPAWHLCHKQADTQPAALAFQPHIWSKEV